MEKKRVQKRGALGGATGHPLGLQKKTDLKKSHGEHPKHCGLSQKRFERGGSAPLVWLKNWPFAILKKHQKKSVERKKTVKAQALPAGVT